MYFSILLKSVGSHLNIQGYSTETNPTNLLTSNDTPQKPNFPNTHGSSKKIRDLIPLSGQTLSEFRMHTPLGEIVAIFALRKNFPY